MWATCGTILLAGVLALQASPRPPAPPPDARPPANAAQPAAEPEPVVTHHEIRVNGKSLRYTATTGFLPLKSEAGEIEARIFFIAYTLDGVPAGTRRPLTISFNGGPGSSSVWLHLGALGPRRVRLLDNGMVPPPPYELVDNEFTWLDQTDLVFVDPVGTGYSRAAKPGTGRRFWSVQGDVESIAEFIRLFLSRYDRWASPLFMVGESYGTTRAAGLAGYLIDRGIAFNGILLLSSVLNFQTIQFTRANELPYVLYLPSYTATAWYHKRLPADLQGDLQGALRQSEQWATTEYALALAKGSALSGAERQRVVAQLARFTGLDAQTIDDNDVRIEIQRFCKALLRGRRTVGRLDSRFTGVDLTAAGERPEYDPSLAAVRPPYTAMLNDYVRRDLGFASDLPYYILGGGVDTWDWGKADEGFPNTGDALRAALARNPHMRLFVGSGYFDLATPYFATEYTLAHLGLEPDRFAQITRRTYAAGHMMYIDAAMLAALRRDVGTFITDAAGAR